MIQLLALFLPPKPPSHLLGVFYDGPLGNKNEFWQKCGVKAVEMEASVLFVMSTLRNVKTGCILNVDNYIFQRYCTRTFMLLQLTTRLDPNNEEGYKPHRSVVVEVRPHPSSPLHHVYILTTYRERRRCARLLSTP